jgi:hypothetical protein
VRWGAGGYATPHLTDLVGQVFARLPQRAAQERGHSGPLGSGFVLAIPTPDLDATYDLWRAEGLPVTLEPAR